MPAIQKTSSSKLPTIYGDFLIHVYTDTASGIEHVALVKGNVDDLEDVLVRVHSECLTGDIFASARCDCGEQLHIAQQLIADAGSGVIIYLRDHEGRGIGLANKIHAYALQDDGLDTVEANVALGLPVDTRSFSAAGEILKDLKVRSIQLLSNNPNKEIALKKYGVNVSRMLPLRTIPTSENTKYLKTKHDKLGHFL